MEGQMIKSRFFVVLFVLMFLSTPVVFSFSGQDLSANDLIQKNIQAAGGKDRLSKIKNYSFKTGLSTYFLSNNGEMKITTGKAPVITDVIFADEQNVKNNSFNKVMEFSPLMKATYQGLALFRSGVFTLINFKDKLELKGKNKFGPKNYHVLATQIGDLEIEFYLDSKEFTIRRMVFQGYSSDQEKYEVNHDIGPFQEIDGIKFPTSWFSSQVGKRGSLYEVNEIKLNENLGKDFFSKIEVNIGDVKVGTGALAGNILNFTFRRNMLMIGTNWTVGNTKRAGLKSKDKLVLFLKDKEFEIDFYETPPPRAAMGSGAKIMMPNRSGENFIIYLLSPEFKQLADKLKILLPIQVKRK